MKAADLRVVCERRIASPTLADTVVLLRLEPRQWISRVHVLNYCVMLPPKYEALPLALKSLQSGGENGHTLRKQPNKNAKFSKTWGI